jgi:hypothetical protein
LLPKENKVGSGISTRAATGAATGLAAVAVLDLVCASTIWLDTTANNKSNILFIFIIIFYCIYKVAKIGI